MKDYNKIDPLLKLEGASGHSPLAGSKKRNPVKTTSNIKMNFCMA